MASPRLAAIFCLRGGVGESESDIESERERERARAPMASPRLAAIFCLRGDLLPSPLLLPAAFFVAAAFCEGKKYKKKIAAQFYVFIFSLQGRRVRAGLCCCRFLRSLVCCLCLSLSLSLSSRCICLCIYVCEWGFVCCVGVDMCLGVRIYGCMFEG